MTGVTFGKDKQIVMGIEQHQLCITQDDDRPADFVHNAAHAADIMRDGKAVRAWASVGMVSSVHMFLSASNHVDR